MKQMFMLFIVLSACLFADVRVTKTVEREGPVILPVPPERPVRPVPVVLEPAVVYQENYYQPTLHESCAELQEVLREKDQEIQRLRDEVKRLKAKEQARLQKSLKAEHEAELKKFEEKKRSVKSQNSISITEKKE